MNTIACGNLPTPLRRAMLVMLAAGCLSLMTACEPAFVPILGEGETNHAQEFATFLQDLAREAFAAYLF